MPTVVDVKVFPMCIVDTTEFTLVCYWIELQQFLARQTYHSLQSSYKKGVKWILTAVICMRSGQTSLGGAYV